jgi:hypothetical protein
VREAAPKQRRHGFNDVVFRLEPGHVQRAALRAGFKNVVLH